MSAKNLPNLKDVSRVPEELLPVLHWWQDSGPKTLTYVTIAIAVIAAGYLWFDRSRTNRERSVEMLSTAVSAEDYEAIVALNTPASEIARLDLARSLYAAGDYDNALAVYEEAEKNLSDDALVDIAVVGKICTLEALNRLDEAMAALTTAEASILSAETTHYLAGEVLLAKARILCQKGDKVAAKAALEPLFTADESAPLAKYEAQAKRTAAMIDAYTPKSLFDKAAEATAQ